MRLLRVTADNSLELQTFSGEVDEPYAILSHRWGEDDEEVHYSDVYNSGGYAQHACSCKPAGGFEHKPGYKKITLALEQARRDGLKYLWIDTCCIDKSSSAELSEAINSMYHWYERASVCYAYLVDIVASEERSSIGKSDWFTRGWTLQELIAPPHVVFYGRHWGRIGSKQGLAKELSQITGIERSILNREKSIEEASVAQRMSWASRRKTKRVEDVAYCLLGIFSVNMPLLYGERGKAFLRLQEEIAKEHPDDQTLFAWVDSTAQGNESQGMLARHPWCFANSGSFVPCIDLEARKPFSLVSKRLELEIRLLADYTAILGCCDIRTSGVSTELITVKLIQTSDLKNEFRRIHCNKLGFQQCQGTLSTIYVPQSKISSALHNMRYVLPHYLLLFREVQTALDFEAEVLDCYVEHYLSPEERKGIFGQFSRTKRCLEYWAKANTTPVFIGTPRGSKTLAVALHFSITKPSHSGIHKIMVLVGMGENKEIEHKVIADPPDRTFSTLQNMFCQTSSRNQDRELSFRDSNGYFWCNVACTVERVDDRRKYTDMPCWWVTIRICPLIGV